MTQTLFIFIVMNNQPMFACVWTGMLVRKWQVSSLATYPLIL